MIERYNVLLLAGGIWFGGECSGRAYDSCFATSDPHQTLTLFKPKLLSQSGMNPLPYALDALMIKPSAGVIIPDVVKDTPEKDDEQT